MLLDSKVLKMNRSKEMKIKMANKDSKLSLSKSKWFSQSISQEVYINNKTVHLNQWVKNYLFYIAKETIPWEKYPLLPILHE